MDSSLGTNQAATMLTLKPNAIHTVKEVGSALRPLPRLAPKPALVFAAPGDNVLCGTVPRSVLIL
jgi:hypothetical protein